MAKKRRRSRRGRAKSAVSSPQCPLRLASGSLRSTGSASSPASSRPRLFQRLKTHFFEAHRRDSGIAFMVVSFVLMGTSLYFLFFHSSWGSDVRLGSAAITTVLVLGTGIATYQLLFYDHQHAVSLQTDGTVVGCIRRFALEYQRSARISLYGLWTVITLTIVVIIWITAEMRSGGWFQLPMARRESDSWDQYLPYLLAYGGRVAAAVVGLFLVKMQLHFYRRAIRAYEHLQLASIALSDATAPRGLIDIGRAKRMLNVIKHGSVFDVPDVPYEPLLSLVRLVPRRPADESKSVRHSNQWKPGDDETRPPSCVAAAE